MTISLLLCLISAIWASSETSYTFDTFLQAFSKSYHPKEHDRRKAIFEANLKEIQAHNADPSKTWQMGVNQFTDQTEAEKRLLLGLDKRQLHLEKIRFNAKNPNMDNHANLNALPKHVDWRLKNVVTPVKDQGKCGSCWSFGTAEAVESYWALATGELVSLSEQQILDCTQNPHHCGGTGGCGGGTAQIAMDQIKAMGGLASEWTYPYVSYFGEAQTCQLTRAKPYAKLSGWERLPMNKLEPVMKHLATVGPLIINVEASTWHSYKNGIFDGCNKTNPDVNHIVLLVGYGTDAALGDYWLVRNSWTAAWGELGYIRLRRRTVPTCGIDLTPRDGDLCDDGPETIQVCGTCGVIYDATYPVVSH